MKSPKRKTLISWALITIYSVLIGICLKLYVDYGGFNASNDAARYKAQAMAVLIGVLLFLVIRRLWKLFPHQKYRRFVNKLKKAVRKAAARIYEKIAVLVNKVGIGRKRYNGGRDEYSFIFNEAESKKTRLSVGTVSKWNTLADNSEKIRFIFVRYMLGRIRRGYHKRQGKTPDEWAADLGVKGDALELFENYSAARYSCGSVVISDDAVERAKRIIDKKRPAK